MEAFFISTISVATAEIGDKTQLLALLLAARFNNKAAIIFGILVATLINHALAALVGEWASTWFDTDTIRYVVAGSFFAVAIWVLIPDSIGNEETNRHTFGPFITTVLLFFIAEMGDKTQVATVLLAAKYQDLTSVVLGTTIGMLIANAPVVLLGHFSASKLPLDKIRIGCACLFGFIGLASLIWG